MTRLENHRSAQATAVAHVNIALIKYWGKADEKLVIPQTSSLSLTLDDLYTTTSVHFREPGSGDDTVTLDGKEISGRPLERVVNFLDIVRQRSGRDGQPADVESFNTVPTAAGLASSASGFAALAAASSAAAGLDLDQRQLSRLARLGSGSASRSIFGGLALWNAGTDDQSSFAEPVSTDLDLAIVVLVLDSGKKSVSSREAMRRTVRTSPDYQPWVISSATDLEQALAAVKSGDIESLGDAVERNALGMHATMWSAVPPVNYFTEETKLALTAVKQAREAGFPAWATMDAGPNVKVLTDAASAQMLAERLRSVLSDRVPHLRTIVAYPGPGVEIRR